MSFRELLPCAVILIIPSVGVLVPSVDDQDSATNQTEASEISKFGIPIYNYEHSLAHQFSGLVLAENSGREIWNVVTKEPIRADSVSKLCGKFRSRVTCGDIAGEKVEFLDVNATKDDLDAFLNQSPFSGYISFYEPNLPISAVPDSPEELPDTETGDKGGGPEVMAGSSSISWGLDRIGAYETKLTGEGVNIFILDTGIALHKDFGNRAVPTVDLNNGKLDRCRPNSACARDNHGHGTHVAGTAGGQTHGVAREAKIWAAKMMGDNGKGDTSHTIKVIDYITRKAPRPAIISMSLGSRYKSQSEKAAIDRAVAKGITVVVAAGNNREDACNYSPAFVQSAITVGATDIKDSRWASSNHGECVDIYAPGENIISASHRSSVGTAKLSGTSMAAPHVTGVAALILQKNPLWTPAQVKRQLLDWAEKGTIRNLKQNDPIFFLRIGSSFGQGPIKPVPVQPIWDVCPDGRVPKGGTCACSPTSECYTKIKRDGQVKYVLGCQLSDGRYASSHFLLGCVGCVCL